MKMKTLIHATLGVTAVAAVCTLPAQAQDLRVDSEPYVIVTPVTPHEQSAAGLPAESASSRDNHGLPTNGAWGTGDIDRMTAMNRWDSGHEHGGRAHRQRLYEAY